MATQKTKDKTVDSASYTQMLKDFYFFYALVFLE